MIIRKCSLEEPDWLNWIDMRCRLWPDIDREEELVEIAELLTTPDQFAVFIAYSEQSEAIGFAEVSIRADYVNGTISSPVGFLEGIYVLPEYRRSGIARTLVKTVEEWVRSKSCTELASDADINNIISHNMHLALDFKETERVVYFSKLL